MDNKRVEAVVSTLMRLDVEARECKDDLSEYTRKVYAIDRLINQVETDFGFEQTLFVIALARKSLGHGVPLDYKVMKRLHASGCQLSKVHNVLSYEKAHTTEWTCVVFI